MATTVGRQDVQALVGAGATLVEVLPHEEYELEHLPGAVNLPLSTLTGEVLAQLELTSPVVVYCNDSQ